MSATRLELHLSDREGEEMRVHCWLTDGRVLELWLTEAGAESLRRAVLEVANARGWPVEIRLEVHPRALPFAERDLGGGE